METKEQTILSIDLGGTKILIGEVNELGEVLASKRYPSDVSSQINAVLKIKAALNDYQESIGFIGNPIGIGIGVVGRVDREHGLWIEINPSVSQPVYLVKEIEDEFKLPCFIANDVYCATLAEITLGNGNLTKNSVYLNIGTGIAACVVVENQIIEGGHFNAGEIGHMVVDMHSEVLCPCGRKGCVEVLASGLGLHNRAMAVMKDYPESIVKKPVEINTRISGETLFQAYDQGDALARAVVGEALVGVANLIMNLVRVSDPEVVVLGGGVVQDGWFLKQLTPYLNEKTLRFVTYGVVLTSLEAKTIGIKGCSILAFNQLKSGKVQMR
ncbi:ROK family protein [Carnobacterium gallinarum]|uniref:ROK family protein n=1 Tax=Carnobacterium gallinarum TaxID=2749 RepID=UPI0005545F65|nr:ROK family protein [Carnobacterium gallinarum]